MPDFELLLNQEIGIDMTPETKAYLDEHFRHLEQRILDITNPIKVDIETFRGNFREIYIRLGKSETDIAILKDNKNSRQVNTTTVIAIVFGILAVGAAIIGFIT